MKSGQRDQCRTATRLGAGTADSIKARQAAGNAHHRKLLHMIQPLPFELNHPAQRDGQRFGRRFANHNGIRVGRNAAQSLCAAPRHNYHVPVHHLV